MGELVFLAALLGTAWAWLRRPAKASADVSRFSRSWLWALFLWLPLPFYAYSVSYGSVPIFLPVWKPFSWYNTRYGMELFPALALFFGFAVEAVLVALQRRHGYQPKYRTWAIAAMLFLLAANIAEMLREKPLTYEEAVKNAGARGYYNQVIADALKPLHALDPNGVVLMDTSTFPTIVPNAGLTYRQTINESDKEFYWAALGAPAAHASIVLAFAGDEIDKAVHAHPEHLRLYRSFHAQSKGWDQLDAAIYVTDTFPVAQLPPPSTAVPGR
jgi:hypothetical protein